MPFTAGDIVKCLVSHDSYQITVGKFYRVVDHSDGMDNLEYTAVINNSGGQWYVRKIDFELAPDREVETDKIITMTIQAGEFVKATRDGSKKRYRKDEIFLVVKSPNKSRSGSPQIILSTGERFFPNWNNFVSYVQPVSIEELQAKGSNTTIGNMQLTIIHSEYISKAQLAQLKDMLHTYHKYNKFKTKDFNTMLTIADKVKKIKSFKKGYRVAATGRPVSITLMSSPKQIAIIV